MNTMAPGAAAPESEFDLDVSIVESVPVDGGLMCAIRSTRAHSSYGACRLTIVLALPRRVAPFR